MTLVSRRLFWKVYLALIASLVAATILMGVFLWFLGEAQREMGPPASRPGHPVRDVTLFDRDGHILGARGAPITEADRQVRLHPWAPRHILRLDLPGGGYALTRLGPSRHARARMFLLVMLIVAGGGALAAYPLTALLTRRLEILRAGVARWGEGGDAPHLDESGEDEVAALARTFNAAAMRLAGLLASQKALLANASHELRSPLARLRVAIEIAQPEGATRAEIVRNLSEMDQLVEELLLSSRLDHPQARQDARETIDLLGLAAEEAARGDAVVSGEPVEIEGDGVLLRRLLRNLLENAAKHGRPPIEITIRREGDAAVLAVTDAGRTIAPDQRERIFEPFYRPSGSGEAAGGWGLGLALVRQIAGRHGGTVVCDSPFGGGTRFTVRLAGSAQAALGQQAG